MRKLTIKESVLAMVVSISIISLGVSIEKHKETKDMEKTITLMKEEKYSESMDVFNKNSKDKGYVKKLNNAINGYEEYVFNEFIEGKKTYEQSKNQYEYLVKMCNSESLNNKAREVNFQKNILDKLEEVKKLEEQGEYIEAFKILNTIEPSKCLIYKDLNTHITNLKVKAIEDIDDKLKGYSVDDAYLYLLNFPVRFDEKIYDYKLKVIEKAKNDAKKVSTDKALNNINALYEKVKIDELISIKSEYEMKKQEEDRLKKEAEEKKKEEENIKRAKTMLINTYNEPQYSFEYVGREKRENADYWVFSIIFDEIESQVRPMVNIKTFEICEKLVDGTFRKFGENTTAESKYENTTIAKLNSNPKVGSYKVQGKVVKINKGKMILTDNKGNYLCVDLYNTNVVVGDYITVKGTYFATCNDFAYYGVFPMDLPHLNLGELEIAY